MQNIIEIIKSQCQIDIHSVHGISHWENVRLIGNYLAERNGADLLVIDFFAYFHDSKRFNDGKDFEHARRGAEFVIELYQKGNFCLNLQQCEKLIYAIAHHNNKTAISNDVTIQTCWDADRLDLWRLGIRPDAGLLCTNIAKYNETIEFARQLNY